MKILHVGYSTRPDVTGASVRTHHLAKTQLRLGVLPVVVSSPFQPPADPSQRRSVEHLDGIAYYRCYNGSDASRFMAEDKPLWERASKMAALASFTSDVRRAAVEQRAEVIHAHGHFFCGLAALAAGRHLGLPVVYEIRSLMEEGLERPGVYLRQAYRFFDGFCCRRASHVVVLCDGLRREWVRRGVPATKITVCGNGVDAKPEGTGEDRCAKEQMGFPPDAFILGYIGALVPYEGLDLLLDAAALLIPRHARLRVLIAGEGSARAALERQARALGIADRVRLQGPVPHDKTGLIYRTVDLFALPRRATRLTDTVTPLKPLEVMAYGGALLAGDCGGHREVITDGVTGVLFPAGDPQVLAARIEAMMAEPEKCRQLGRKAREWVLENRTWELQCRPVIALYERLIVRPRRMKSVLLVAPAPRPNVVCGVENGVALLLRSSLAGRYQIRVWNRAPAPQSDRRVAARCCRQAGHVVRFLHSLIRSAPDVVHIKSSSGVNFVESAMFALLSRIWGRRTILQIHSGEFERWYRRQDTFQRFGIRVALRVPHEIAVLSECWRDFLAGLGVRRIHVVPNAVELPELARRRCGNSHMTVLTIATLSQKKGLFDVLAAAKQLANLPVRFVLAGPDEIDGRGEGQEVRRRAIDLRLMDTVEFTGPVNYKEKGRLLGAADVFLLPSHSEGMPNVVLEAMAAGLPVVTTPVGSLPEMLGGGRGARFVAVADFEGIAAALIDLWEHPGVREAMGRWNRARVEAHYRLDLLVGRLDALYQGAEARTSPGASLAEPAREKCALPISTTSGT